MVVREMEEPLRKGESLVEAVIVAPVAASFFKLLEVERTRFLGLFSGRIPSLCADLTSEEPLEKIESVELSLSSELVVVEGTVF